MGIEVTDGWDKNRRCPRTAVVDPRIWIPDIDTDVNNGSSYHGFELSMRKEDMKASAGYHNTEHALTDKQIKDTLEKINDDNRSSDAKQNRLTMSSVRGL